MATLAIAEGVGRHRRQRLPGPPTGAAVDAIDPARPATLDQAVRELTQTKRLAEDEVAAALDVRMGFSDADGD